MSGDDGIDCDVVIIGAGLAGLSAARQLHRAGERVLVFDAREEVGGRALTREVGGETADLGGEWLGRAHRRLGRLVSELGLEVEKAANVGRPALWRLPSRESVGVLPPAHVLPSLTRAFVTASWLSRGMSAEAPWSCPRAAALDARSVTDWLDELSLNSDTRYLLERLFGAAACGALESTSLLQLVWQLRVAGGPLRSFNSGFQWQITGGAQQVPLRIAQQLGERIRTGSACRSIEQDGTAVMAAFEDRQVRARHAVVAVPVTQLPAIRFDPPLDADQQRLSDIHIGAGAKVIGVLPPRHDPRHHMVVGGEVLWAAWRRGRRVTGFAPAVTDAGDSALIADLARAFGLQPADMRATTVIRWAEQDYIHGCDVVFAPGQVTALGPHLTRPHGLIEFAGAERSSWPLNMEGAVRSGERAATAILERRSARA